MPLWGLAQLSDSMTVKFQDFLLKLPSVLLGLAVAIQGRAHPLGILMLQKDMLPICPKCILWSQSGDRAFA